MLITALYQKVSMKIFALLLSLFYAANGAAAAPSTAAPIKSEQANMSFVAIADSQVSTYLFSRYKTFVSAAQDIVNNAGSFDALCFVGDIAENGLAEEFQLVYDGIKDADCRFITATGNHDIRIRSYKQSSKRFADFTNALNGDEAMEKMHYTQVVNGYKFIVLGSDRTEFEEAYLSPEQLAWLDSELAAESGSGKPAMSYSSSAISPSPTLTACPTFGTAPLSPRAASAHRATSSELSSANTRMCSLSPVTSIRASASIHIRR